MFAMPKVADLNDLLQGGQLYWAFPFSKGSMIKPKAVMPIEVTVYTLKQQTFNSRELHMLKSFDKGLASAKGQKLECFKWKAKNISIITMKI
jgi:hypothetical protein